MGEGEDHEGVKCRERWQRWGLAGRRGGSWQGCPGPWASRPRPSHLPSALDKDSAQNLFDGEVDT